MAANRPFFVILPGASQNPAHYGYLCHLLLSAGYPTYTGLLPSVGTRKKVTAADDEAYVRDNLILPILDEEEHDVIIVCHSYSSVPGSAAAKGLSKAERTAQGKKTGVIGQIFIAALITKGDTGGDVLAAFGGQYPPHIRPEPENNILRCDDRIGPLFHDVEKTLGDAAAVTAMAQGMTSFESTCPRASWDQKEYDGRRAYIRTLDDAGIPAFMQKGMVDGSGVEWVVHDIKSAHSPQLSVPNKLADLLIATGKEFVKVQSDLRENKS